MKKFAAWKKRTIVTRRRGRSAFCRPVCGGGRGHCRNSAALSSCGARVSSMHPTPPRRLRRMAPQRCLRRLGIARSPLAQASNLRIRASNVVGSMCSASTSRRCRLRKANRIFSVSFDWSQKFAFVGFVSEANRITGSSFVFARTAAVLYGHRAASPTLLFASAARLAAATARPEPAYVERSHCIAARTASTTCPRSPTIPRTSGQIDSLKRTVRDGTIKRPHWDHRAQIERHVLPFGLKNHFRRPSKTPKSLEIIDFSRKSRKHGEKYHQRNQRKPVLSM
jgi:hypothetical protein